MDFSIVEGAFVLRTPPQPDTPVVVSIPHAGTGIHGFEEALSPDLDVRCDADLHVDRLYRLGEPGAPPVHVASRLSRFVCDLNRDPDDVSRGTVPEHPAPRNTDGRGTLTYQATVVTQALQRELVRDVLKRAGLTSPDQNLPQAVKVRHGRNQQGLLLHYYLNFSDQEHSITYPYRRGTDLLTDRTLRQGEPLALKPWDPAVIAEHTDGVRFISSSR